MHYMRNTLLAQKKSMARLGCIATFTVLLLSLVALGRDFTAHASQGLSNSSFVAVHRSNYVMVKNEPRAEEQITGAGGKGYFRGRRMKGVKVAVTTGDAGIYTEGSSLGSQNTENPSDTTLNSDPQDRGQDGNYPVTERTEPRLLHGSQDHHTLQPSTPKLAAAAAAEIFKMMHKDYPPKARRRPPINNKLPPANHAGHKFHQSPCIR